MSGWRGVSRLAISVMCVSEARRGDIVTAIAQAFLKVNKTHVPEQGRLCSAAVLNVFSDVDYNRSVITVVGELGALRGGLTDACHEACTLIDLSKHQGVHPCLGVVDLVPIYPLSHDVTLTECAELAKHISNDLAVRVSGFSSFLFGAADDQSRSLLEQRKRHQWFHGNDPTSDPRHPKVDPRIGITAIGATPMVMNCNITLDTTNVRIGQDIASRIRGSNPPGGDGLAGVQAMAFPNNGRVEIGCNIEALMLDPAALAEGKVVPAAVPPLWSINGKVPESLDSGRGFTLSNQYLFTSAEAISDKIGTLAREKGVRLYSAAVLVNQKPCEAISLARDAFQNGVADVWRNRSQITM